MNWLNWKDPLRFLDKMRSSLPAPFFLQSKLEREIAYPPKGLIDCASFYSIKLPLKGAQQILVIKAVAKEIHKQQTRRK